MRSMEDTTPRTRAGTVRMSISSSDPKNAEAVSCKPAGVLYSVRFLLKRDVSRVKRRSITKPPRNTVTAAISRRAAATLGAKSRNVRTSAAGFSDGDASIIASDGPSREERSYIALKTGATQQEQSISGAPATPAATCARRGLRLNIWANHSGGTKARTAAPIKMPNVKAGQITAK